MTNSPSPLVPRRVLAMQLRNLRRAARLTHIDVANRLGWQQGKVSKIESARQSIPVEVAVALAEVCHATPEQRDWFVRLAKTARGRGWWESYVDVVSAECKTYFGLETDADVVSLFAVESVPDLLQTSGYAQRMVRVRGAGEPVRGIERRLEMLLERQRNLFVNRRVRFNVVLAESVVCRIVGGPEVFGEQLSHVTELASRANVDLRVLPFSAGAVPVAGPFTIFEFTQEPHPEVVFIPHQCGGVYLEQEEEVQRYHQTMKEVTSRSLTPEETVRFLEQARHREYAL